MKVHNKLFAIIAGTILLIAAIVIYRYGFPQLNDDATRLSAIVLIGLALTVVFMAILAIIYSVMGVENKDQPLGLPEGSVRALLAFSLVLIFVCLAAFLFSAVNDQACANCKQTLSRVNDVQLSDLKTNFLVAAEQARDEKGKLLYVQVPDPSDKTQKSTIDDLKHPLYSVTYYPKQSRDASDFAKQIFTTLATIFISVVSFYFGSSVTSSAVGAGARAAQGPEGDKRGGALQTALTNAHADFHDAQLAAYRALMNLNQARADSDKFPDDTQKRTALTAAQTALEDANKDLQEKQVKVKSARNALKDAKE